MVRITPMIAALLLLCVPAVSDTVTVSSTVTYADNHNDANGPYFIPRDVILDHDYRRGAWQDWGWTHDMSSLVPAGATGIASATLKIRDWDVADEWSLDIEATYPEEDRIYAIRTSGGTEVSFIRDGDTPDKPLKLPTTLLGNLAQTGQYKFGATTFTISDAGVLADMWTNDALGIFMNIDALASPYCGHQVTLIYSTLTVDYIVPPTSWEPTLTVYRFWSDKTGTHFYTTKEAEKEKLLNDPKFSSIWTYEGIAFHTYPDKRQNDVGTYPVLAPVNRFWSDVRPGHFFTIKEGEKDKLMAWCTDAQAKESGIPSTWTYEGIAFYAHPPKVNEEDPSPPANSLPVYRFYSPQTNDHFYTIKESEKNTIIAEYPESVWTYEGIGWYAYP